MGATLDNFTTEYRKLKSSKEKKDFITSSVGDLSFEELFELWWYESRLLYTCPTLRIESLKALLSRAENSPKNLVYMTTRTTRGDIRKKTTEMLLKHFKEDDRIAVSGFSSIEIITVAKFLMNTGGIKNDTK